MFGCEPPLQYVPGQVKWEPQKTGAANPMNFHPIMAEAAALGVADVTGFLRKELPRRWMTDYKEATPRPTNVLSI
jgi:hypothetical protein